MGPTGSGKSTAGIRMIFNQFTANSTQLINFITGRSNAKIGHALESMTKELQVVNWTYQNRSIKLVDTPGFDDTYTSSADVFQMIAEYLRDLYASRSIPPGKLG